MKKLMILALALTGCASQGPRTMVDSGMVSRPSWVSSPKVSWTEGDRIILKSQFTVRGDERPNACLELARLDGKETLIREISEEIKGQIDSAQEGISENAEIALTQVRSSEFGGKVVGMRFDEQYLERYAAGGVERIDCFVLSSISRADYDSIRRQVLMKISEADPEIKRAIKNRALKFFSTTGEKPEVAQPSATQAVANTPAEPTGE